MLNLGDCIVVIVAKEEIKGEIIGIDFYSLENFDGREKQWPSYTLVSEDKGLYSRFWITVWDESDWVLWTTGKKLADVKNMLPEKSGIAKIVFSGDQGVSTPCASLALCKAGRGKYYAMERFADSDVMFFDGQEIKKPKVLKNPPVDMD